MSDVELKLVVEGMAEVTGEPVKEYTSARVPVTRFVVSAAAPGPMSSPPRMPLYVWGEEAERCARLRCGDVVEIVADLRERQRSVGGVEFPEAAAQIVERVKLRFRPESAGTAA